MFIYTTYLFTHTYPLRVLSTRIPNSVFYQIEDPRRTQEQVHNFLNSRFSRLLEETFHVKKQGIRFVRSSSRSTRSWRSGKTELQANFPSPPIVTSTQPPFTSFPLPFAACPARGFSVLKSSLLRGKPFAAATTTATTSERFEYNQESLKRSPLKSGGTL